MKKTTKEYNKMISKFFGLKEGDTIKIKKESDFLEAKVIKNGDNDALCLALMGQIFASRTYLSYLLDEEYEIVEKPTKLGEMRCTEKECQECPLRILDCLLDEIGKVTLYEMLDNVCEYRKISKDSDVYKAFKEMLDAKGIISL